MCVFSLNFFNRQIVGIILGFLLYSNVGLAQQYDPSNNVDSLPKFYVYEAGFITKSGCKIIPSAYYCLSDGRYYFAVGDKKNYFYLDTNEVLQYQNIELGKDQQFSAKKRAGFARRFWLGTVIVGGPLAVALGAGGMFLIGVAANGPYDGGGFFVGGLAICTTIFCKVLKSAFINVREHNAYKEAVHYVCL